MERLRLVGPSIDTYGSRREWKRRRRDRQPSFAGRPGPSLTTVALASLVILAAITLAVLVVTQLAQAFAG